MIKNKHKVPKGLWSEFGTDEAKKIYNDVMDQALPNQSTTVHPEASTIPKAQWQTICHNIAFYAVQSILEKKLKPGTPVIDVNKNDREVKRRKFK